MKRNLHILYAISFFEGMVFYSSVSTLYRQAVGVSVFQMTVIETVSWGLSFALELPWGIVADRIGYKRVMVLSYGLYFVSKIIFWRAGGFSDFLVERVLLAIVVSGLSGVDSSFIYLSAGEEKSQRAFGVCGALETAGVLASTGVYALFLGEDLRLAAFLTVLSYLAVFVLTFFLVEVRPAERDRRAGLRASVDILKDTLKNRPLMRLVLAFALFGETGHMVTVFLNQLQYTKAGLSYTAISAIYMVMTLTEFATVFSEPLTKKVKARGMGLVFSTLSAAACIALALTADPVLSVAGVLVLSVSSALLSPLAAKLENDAVTVADRATALSMGALAADILAAGLDLVFGWLADTALPLAMLFGAAVILAGGAVFLRAVRAEKAES